MRLQMEGGEGRPWDSGIWDTFMLCTGSIDASTSYKHAQSELAKMVNIKTCNRGCLHTHQTAPSRSAGVSSAPGAESVKVVRWNWLGLLGWLAEEGRVTCLTNWTSFIMPSSETWRDRQTVLQTLEKVQSSCWSCRVWEVDQSCKYTHVWYTGLDANAEKKRERGKRE